MREGKQSDTITATCKYNVVSLSHNLMVYRDLEYV